MDFLSHPFLYKAKDKCTYNEFEFESVDSFTSILIDEWLNGDKVYLSHELWELLKDDKCLVFCVLLFVIVGGQFD